MKTFNKIAAQGDVYLYKLPISPEKARDLLRANRLESSGEKTEKGEIIVTHSETGHHHVVDGDCAVLLRPSEKHLGTLRVEAPELFSGDLPMSITDQLLIMDRPEELAHLRDYDTHESLGLEGGAVYLVRRQVEFDFESQMAKFVVD